MKKRARASKNVEIEDVPVEEICNPTDISIEEAIINEPIIMEPVAQGRGGLIIGSYRVTKTLGQGTFGKVKEGVHLYTQQKVAIKILEKNKITDVNDVERVAREIHILKIVNHPNIIQLYEIIETPTRLFLIMEHCCNGELFSYITSKNKLKEEESCRLFQQLIAALEYIGRLGIVHRDVKPENLLLDEQKNLKVVDFGLSNTFKQGEKLQTACGSPCYAAPELIKGLEYMGPKADLWSAGVVLFTLVCGHLPFEDNNTQSLYQKILAADYKFTCYLSQEVRNLIDNILVPDPELRYGLKQITSNSWFKNCHKSQDDISKLGYEVGVDPITIYSNCIDEMKECTEIVVDGNYVRHCLQANRHNALTAHYHLLIKRKLIQGEPLISEQEGQKSYKHTSGMGRINRHMDPSQQVLIAAGRQTKKYQSIEPHRTTLYNEKNKYQLRKIAEGLHEFSNIKRIQPTDVEPEESYLSPAEVNSPVMSENGLVMNKENNPNAPGKDAATKFLFSPQLTDEGNEDKDDDYCLSQQKNPSGGGQQMIFSPTGARTKSNFRQFPISPKQLTQTQPIQKVSLQQEKTAKGKIKDNNLSKEELQKNQDITNKLLGQDDQANQIYQIFDLVSDVESIIEGKTVGDMLNRPDTGFELFGKGSVGASSKISGLDCAQIVTTMQGQKTSSMLDFVSEQKLIPSDTSAIQVRNRNCSSIQLQRDTGGKGDSMVGHETASSSLVPATGQHSTKRKTAPGGSHKVQKKKSSTRGEHYSRKTSSNLEFIPKTVNQINRDLNTISAMSPTQYIQQNVPNQKAFDQQIRQIMNQSQIVESDQILMVDNDLTANMNASDLRKMTSQLSKNMPNYQRISTMTNYATTQMRGNKQSKTKVRGNSSGTGGVNNGNKTQIIQHGLLSGISSGIKVSTVNPRKTGRSTRENLDRVQGSNTGKSNKTNQNSIKAHQNVRKGSVSVISPSTKVPAGSSGETQNTRLISSGSQIQGSSLIKTTSSQGANRNNPMQMILNTMTGKVSKAKGAKNTINAQENKLQLHNSKVDALKNLDKEIQLTFQQFAGTNSKPVQDPQLKNSTILSNLVSPNNQAAAHFLTQHAVVPKTQNAATSKGMAFPTSPLNMIQSPQMNRITGIQNQNTIENENQAPMIISEQQMVAQILNQTQPLNTKASQGVNINNLIATPNSTTQQPQTRSKKGSQVKSISNQAYLMNNNQHSGSKHRNVARANSTIAYSSQNQGTHQLNEFTVASQFQHQHPPVQSDSATNKLQASRNLHARAMTSMGTTAGPSIMSPNSGYAPGFTNVPLDNTTISKVKKPSTSNAGHKRVASTIVASTPPDITTIMQTGGNKIKRDNFLQTQVVSPQLAQMKAQVKPSLKQPKLSGNMTQGQTQKQGRPPSARNRSKQPASVQAQCVSALISPTATSSSIQTNAVRNKRR